MNLALLLFLFGVSLLATGVWWIYPAAALILCGVLLIGLSAVFANSVKK